MNNPLIVFAWYCGLLFAAGMIYSIGRMIVNAIRGWSMRRLARSPAFWRGIREGQRLGRPMTMREAARLKPDTAMIVDPYEGVGRLND